VRRERGRTRKERGVKEDGTGKRDNGASKGKKFKDPKTGTMPPSDECGNTLKKGEMEGSRKASVPGKAEKRTGKTGDREQFGVSYQAGRNRA